MKTKKVMIIGLGVIGGHLLELLVRSAGVTNIITADYNEDFGIRETNLAIHGAAMMGFFPKVEFIKIDLLNKEETATTLEKYQPDIICNCATLQSWWVIKSLPKEIYKEIDKANLAPWLPMHLTLIYNLMQAVKLSGINTHVVSASWPDVINCALGKIGLAPTTGLGDLHNITSAIATTISKKLSIPLRDISLYLMGAHYFCYSVERFGTPGSSPYFLKVMVNDQDITKQLDVDELLSDVIKLSPRPRDEVHNTVAPSSGAKIILDILNDTKEIEACIPGPQGLPGSYPTRFSAEGAEVVLPAGVTLEEAIKINEESNRLDGVDEIRSNGDIVITDKSVEIIKRMLGYDCKILKISESAERAKELAKLYKIFAEKYK